MMSNGDWTIPYLMRAVLVICVFLVFGAILNGLVLKNNRLMLEKDHQTSLRISLLRAEYDRKLGDVEEKYKRTCKRSVREAVKKLKMVANEQKRNATLKVQTHFAGILKNSSNEINQVAEDFNNIIKDVQQLPKKSAFESILVRLKAVKLETPDIDLIHGIDETATGKLETGGVG